MNFPISFPTPGRCFLLHHYEEKPQTKQKENKGKWKKEQTKIMNKIS